jgi:flagellin-specific chaperone FliS
MFFRRHLLAAWRESDAEKIDQVIGLLGELRDAWAEIEGA